MVRMSQPSQFSNRIFALLLCLWLPSLSYTVRAAQCPEESYSLSYQYQVDALSALKCDAVTGNLRILSSEIRDLTGLNSLTSIGGYLSIENTNLRSLEGLANLSSIGGVLWILDNEI